MTSTKIYNGLIFGTTNITEIYHQLLTLRDEAILIGTKLQAETMTEQVITIVDKYMTWTHFGKKNESEFSIPEGETTIHKTRNQQKILSFAVWDFKDKARECIRKDDIDRDYVLHLKIMVMPITDKVLGMEYGSRREFSELLFKCPIVKEYHFQNQTDRPDEISEEDWDIRGSDWDAALPGIGVPLYNGYELTIMDNGLLPLMPEYELLIAVLPTFEQRVEVMAKEWLFQKYFIEIKEAQPVEEEAPEDPNASPWEAVMNERKKGDKTMEIYWKAQARLKSDEGKADMADIENQLRVVLLSTDDMIEKYFNIVKNEE